MSGYGGTGGGGGGGGVDPVLQRKGSSQEHARSSQRAHWRKLAATQAWLPPQLSGCGTASSGQPGGFQAEKVGLAPLNTQVKLPLLMAPMPAMACSPSHMEEVGDCEMAIGSKNSTTANHSSRLSK